MPEWPEVLGGLDAPRPLSPALRAQLEAQLGVDDLAAALADAAAPRPVPPGLRAALSEQLVAARGPLPIWRRPLVVAGAAAAAAAGLVLGAALVTPAHRTPGRLAQPSSAPSATGAGSSPTAGSVGMVGGPAAGLGTVGLPVPSSASGRHPSQVPSVVGGGAAPALAPAPAAAEPRASVASVSPAAGPLRGGTRIVLSGSGLSHVVRVEVGGRVAGDLRVESDSSVSAVTPPGSVAGSVDVVAVLSTGARYGVSPGFTYLAVPRVTGLDPSTGPMAGGNWVTVTGSGFTATSNVAFGSAAAQQVEVVSATMLRALAPASLPGYVDVTVTTAGGTSATGSNSRYLYSP